MTNEEAIEVLSEIYMHVTVDSLEATIMVERHNKALDMAIKALKAQDMTLYMNLPEVTAEEVVEILKRNNRIELLPSDKDTNVPSNDTISRADAIDLVRDVCDAIMSGCESWYDPETEDEVYKDIREVDAILKCNKEIRIALRNMPSAQPEQIRCKDCLIHGICRFEQGLGLDGYCSQAERREE